MLYIVFFSDRLESLFRILFILLGGTVIMDYGIIFFIYLINILYFLKKIYIYYNFIIY